jgi:hypothetical protein
MKPLANGCINQPFATRGFLYFDQVYYTRAYVNL